MKEELSEDILCCILGSDLKDLSMKYNYISISIYTHIHIHTHVQDLCGVVCMCANVHISRIVLNLEYDNSFVSFTQLLQ